MYGSTVSGEFRETDPLKPNSPYSASKAGADLLVWAYHITYGLNTVVTRGSNTFGPHQYPEKLVPLFIINAINNEALPLYGKGKQVRDWLYVDDHCSAIDLVIHVGRAGEIYNVGGGNEKENIEIVRELLGLLGKSENLIRLVQDRPGHDFRYSINTDKIQELGWQPSHDIDSSLSDTVRWYVKNEWWWRPIIESPLYLKYFSQQYDTRLRQT